MHFNYHGVFLAAAPNPLTIKMVHHWPKEWEERLRERERKRVRSEERRMS